MIQRRKSLVAQLRETHGKAEIVDGKIVRMSPASFGHGRIARRICRSLEDYELEQGGGYAIPDNIGFLVNLPHRESFSPDAGWLATDTEPDFSRFVDGAPTFAVEIRSPNDYSPSAEKAILAKIDDYFAAGTLVVWDVELRDERLIRCYHSTAPQSPVLFRRSDVADAEPAVPGWRFPVEQLYR
jgi:Uma2 family endonuclease